jgi:glycosyltransferase involved in cell wall biosynthesis
LPATPFSAEVLARKRGLAASVAALLRSAPVDVVHSHFRHLLEFAGAIPVPLVTTVHYALDRPPQNSSFLAYAAANYIAISRSQRAAAPHLNFVAEIPHGLPVGRFPFGRQVGEYLVFLGRVAPEKGLDCAIRVARRAHLPLAIAARIEPAHAEYFRRQIEPRLGRDGIRFLGELGEAEKLRLLAGARALLMPVHWREPFGLVVIEALACGTPVIGFPRGALPEIVADGEVGALVTDEAEMAAAAAAIGGISRRRCRAHVSRRYSAALMARRHLAVYRRLLPG